MKVAHVTLYPPKGEKHVSSSGVASYSKNLISHLAKQGAEHTVICEIIDRAEGYQEGSVAVRRTFTRTPRFLWDVHKELKKIDPDVVHIQQELALFGGILTAYLLQWLVFLWRDVAVITLHGVVDPQQINKKFVIENNSRLPVWLVKIAFRIIFTPLMRRSRKIIVHEQYFKDIAVKSYGIDPKKIAVVPHGIELLQTIDAGQARQQLGIALSAKVALFMGYATGYKGIDLLIEGFAKYAKNHKDAYLIIGAGKHPKLHDNDAYQASYAELQAKAARLIPVDQYRWEGFIKESDITLYYSASDVSLYPYTTAMASSGPMSFAIGYEKPFLVSTAFQDIFGEYRQLLFERKPDSLAAKLDHFFRHQPSYQDVSVALRVRRNWHEVSRQVIQLYAEAMSEERTYETEKSITTG